MSNRKTILGNTGADGTLVTAANSGFVTINPSTGGIVGGQPSYSAAMAGQLSTGFSFANVANSSSGSLGRAQTTLPSDQIGLNFILTTPVNKPSTAGNNLTLATFRFGTGQGSGSIGKLLFTNSGQFRFDDSGSAHTNLLGAINQSLGTKHRVRIFIDRAAGTFKAQIIRLTDSVTVYDNTVTGQTLGSTTLTAFDLGVVGLIADAQTVGIAELVVEDGTTDVPADYVVPAAPTNPTCDFSSTVNGLSATFTATGTVTTQGATITNYGWNFGDPNTAGAGANTTHTFPAAGTYNVTLTVTDSNGLTGTKTRSVTVVAPAVSVTYASITSSTGWTDQAGASTAAALLSALTDADPATFAVSPNNPSGATIGGPLQPLSIPQAGTNITVSWPIERLNSNSGTGVASLYEGATLRSTVSGLTIPAGSGTSMTANPVSVVFPATDVATIGNFNNLVLLLAVTAA